MVGTRLVRQPLAVPTEEKVVEAEFEEAPAKKEVKLPKPPSPPTKKKKPVKKKESKKKDDDISLDDISDMLGVK